MKDAVDELSTRVGRAGAPSMWSCAPNEVSPRFDTDWCKVRALNPRGVDVGKGQRDSIAELHAEIGREAGRLHVLHAARLQCRQGCTSCCVDDLTVFEAEAAHIRRHHAQLLATAEPHAPGACAFLDAHGGCRIYEQRPYVCRTQGLPLRWLEDRDGSAAELRDICPLNEAGEPLEALPSDACWSLGPTEERLAKLELAAPGVTGRSRLRDLFTRTR